MKPHTGIVLWSWKIRTKGPEGSLLRLLKEKNKECERNWDLPTNWELSEYK